MAPMGHSAAECSTAQKSDQTTGATATDNVVVDNADNATDNVVVLIMLMKGNVLK